MDVKSSNKGLLIPRVALTATNDVVTIPSPAAALVIYNTVTAGSGSTAVSPGFYFWDGTAWVKIASTNNITSSTWLLGGNAGIDPANHFIGTIDNKPLLFKVNNTPAGRINDGSTANSFFGFNTGSMISTGVHNTGIGYSSLFINSTGSGNTAIGSNALFKNSSGGGNTAVGQEALRGNENGGANTALGGYTLVNNTSGGGNVAAGYGPLFYNTTGGFNIGLGWNALSNNTSGSYNIGIGWTALGNNNTSGSYNIGLGYGTEVGANNLTNATAIGSKAKVDCSNCLVLGSVNGTNGATSNTAIGIGTTNPNASAALDISSSDKGLLIPRVAITSSNDVATIPSPTASLVIYNTATAGTGNTAVTPGFYFWDGASWAKFTISNNSTSSPWLLGGNTGINPIIHFIGTADNQPLIFKVNNELAGNIDASSSNHFFGYKAGSNNTTGMYNSATGFQSLQTNTTGNENTATGYAALLSNSTGSWNTAHGAYSLLNNTTGTWNTASGVSALFKNSSGNWNTAHGARALQGTTTGSDNTAIGYDALRDNATGFQNTASGSAALRNNTSGGANTAVGYRALVGNLTGNSNTATGSDALFGNKTGYVNTATGVAALADNNNGYQNTADGAFTLNKNTSGNGNTATGFLALEKNTIGGGNTASGSFTLRTNITGSANTAIGGYADVSTGDLNNATAIGYGAIVDASNKVRIGNTGVTIIEGQVPFSYPSDGRYKFNVQEDVHGLDFITRLRPITYQFDGKKLDEQIAGNAAASNAVLQASYDEAAAIRRTGFIAQEVEKAAQTINYNFSGINRPRTEKDHYSLSYDAFVVPLVKAVQEQQKQIEDLKKENKELNKLKEQVEALTRAVEILSANK
ncbi:tail fiber domain-containing protein [Flavisolibacter sp. BT320]|nr:tail fiber domain-containing protein [Flavisolibacter longurius]